MKSLKIHQACCSCTTSSFAGLSFSCIYIYFQWDLNDHGKLVHAPRNNRLNVSFSSSSLWKRFGSMNSCHIPDSFSLSCMCTMPSAGGSSKFDFSVWYLSEKYHKIFQKAGFRVQALQCPLFMAWAAHAMQQRFKTKVCIIMW